MVRAAAPSRADDAATPAADLILRVRGVRKTYPGVVALDGVDLDVARGEVHCLLGQNGAGKSTLIKVISGLVAPDSGTVEFDGAPLAVGDPVRALRSGIATIYQELDLVPWMRAFENVALGHESARGPLLNPQADITRTRELFAELGHPELDPEAIVGELSPSRQQMVSMARALSHEVRLLILDEPSAILDRDEVEVLFSVVRRLAERDVGVIYITHRLDEVALLADRVTVLKNGGTVLEGRPSPTPAGALVEAMVGRKLDDVFPDRPDSIGAPLLEVAGLSRSREFADVSLSVSAGEVLGLAGLVGSGRTELLRCMYGLSTPSAGSVRVAGAAVRPGSPSAALESGLAMTPEERKSQGLLLDWELDKNVSLPSLRRFTRWGWLRRRRERAAAAYRLEQLNTNPKNPAALARTLSGGNQQKVVLARWLLHGCRVLLLDEPTRGVDVEAKSEIYRQIREFTEAGGGALVVSSEFGELFHLCDRILVMREGRLVGSVDPRTGTEEQVLALALGAPSEPGTAE